MEGALRNSPQRPLHACSPGSLVHVTTSSVMFVNEGIFGVSDDAQVPMETVRWSNGLAAPMDHGAWILTGINTGHVRVTAQCLDAAPPVEATDWEEIVEISVRSVEGDLRINSGYDITPDDLPSLNPQGPGWYRMRVHASGRSINPGRGQRRAGRGLPHRRLAARAGRVRRHPLQQDDRRGTAGQRRHNARRECICGLGAGRHSRRRPEGRRASSTSAVTARRLNHVRCRPPTASLTRSSGLASADRMLCRPWMSRADSSPYGVYSLPRCASVRRRRTDCTWLPRHGRDEGVQRFNEFGVVAAGGGLEQVCCDDEQCGVAGRARRAGCCRRG